MHLLEPVNRKPNAQNLEQKNHELKKSNLQYSTFTLCIGASIVVYYAAIKLMICFNIAEHTKFHLSNRLNMVLSMSL